MEHTALHTGCVRSMKKGKATQTTRPLGGRGGGERMPCKYAVWTCVGNGYYYNLLWNDDV